jgi:hypothetical protein
MANSISVSDADNETMCVGREAIVIGPFAAVTLTGNTAAAAVVGAAAVLSTTAVVVGVAAVLAVGAVVSTTAALVGGAPVLVAASSLQPTAATSNGRIKATRAVRVGRLIRFLLVARVVVLQRRRTLRTVSAKVPCPRGCPLPPRRRGDLARSRRT